MSTCRDGECMCGKRSIVCGGGGSWVLWCRRMYIYGITCLFLGQMMLVDVFSHTGLLDYFSVKVSCNLL